MKKISLLLVLLAITSTVPAFAGRGNVLSRVNKEKSSQIVAGQQDVSNSTYESIRKQYESGKISADSVVSLALYHKVGSPELAERCLKLVSDTDKRGAMELGVLYAFSPEYAKRASEGVKLLKAVAQAGYDEANGYLGFYYFTHKDYKKAKSYFDLCTPMPFGFGYTALGSMYTMGKGVKEDLVKARENYRNGALKGYPRGMSLYGFNLRANGGGAIDYPESFFWLYIAGDLGDDAARTALYLPRKNENRGDSETAQKAQTALEFIQAAQSGKKIQNEPIYKDGFLPSLKAREKAAEQGDDWARYYLGSMNYNGDFLNQNYARALYYYVPIAQNGKLPNSVLAVVHERLAKMYREGKGTKVNQAQAAHHTKLAAKYGSLSSYKRIQHISE